MRAAFHPYLPNGLFGDPAVWIDAPDLGRSLLFDLGELHRVPSKKLLRVDRIVVSHAHMDHFIGFDHLLRLVLGRRRRLTLTGPEGFIERVRSRIAGYTWNLIESCAVELRVEEVPTRGVGGTLRSARFDPGNGLRGEALPERSFDGTVHAGRGYRLAVAVFDHGIPVLGARLDESARLAVDADALRRRGLRPGEWLAELKQHVRRGAPRATPVSAETADGSVRTVAGGPLADEVLSRAPGQSIAYVADLGGTRDNRRRLVEFAHGVDLLICETAFLDEDARLAAERGHLTAKQAGSFAREAGALRLAPFHVSPRYHGRCRELLDEAAAAFGGDVVELPEGPEA